jgi:hypothetical protein
MWGEPRWKEVVLICPSARIDSLQSKSLDRSYGNGATNSRNCGGGAPETAPLPTFGKVYAGKRRQEKVRRVLSDVIYSIAAPKPAGEVEVWSVVVIAPASVLH